MAQRNAKIVARNVKPKHKHDCERCRFIGTLNDHDLYKCSEMGGTIVVRYGNAPEQFGSMMLSVIESVPALHFAGTDYAFALALLARNPETPNHYFAVARPASYTAWSPGVRTIACDVQFRG